MVNDRVSLIPVATCYFGLYFTSSKDSDFEKVLL